MGSNTMTQAVDTLPSERIDPCKRSQVRRRLPPVC